MEHVESSVLLALVSKLADERSDGHFTIMGFTTNYKACYGTPTREDLEELPAHESMGKALLAMVLHPDRYDIKTMPRRSKKGE